MLLREDFPSDDLDCPECGATMGRKGLLYGLMARRLKDIEFTTEPPEPRQKEKENAATRVSIRVNELQRLRAIATAADTLKGKVEGAGGLPWLRGMGLGELADEMEVMWKAMEISNE
jgi:hypothetical protein